MDHNAKRRLLDNQSKPCNVRGCIQPRLGFSLYCSPHNHRKVQYGTPTGRRFLPKDFEFDVARVREIIQANIDHPGVQLGIQFFTDWLEAACTVRGVLARKHFLRLYDEGITAEELLIDCAGIWIYSFANPRQLPSEDPLTFALGIAVLTKARNKRGCVSCQKLPVAERRNVGLRIRQNLGSLFMNIFGMIRKREAEEEIRRNAMVEPLNSPYVAT